MFYLTTHSTHFIYGYMASDIWLRTTQIVREETRCRHMGYSFRLTARVLLYADRIAHTTAFVTPVVEHWVERDITAKLHMHVHGCSIFIQDGAPFSDSRQPMKNKISLLECLGNSPDLNPTKDLWITNNI